jgi:thiamine transport system ATP-binding protein
MVARLELASVTVRFGAAAALADVSLSVPGAERVAVLGPSGAGKSTLLRAIAGLEPLAGGRILLDGADLAGVPVHRRGVGLMFQDYALFPHRDVSGNVEFGLRMRGDPPAARRRRVAEVLELVGLTGFGQRRVTELSGGEAQRVALARALAPEPRLLMLDEPLGALDRALRTRLLDELAQLFARLGLTILYVTHDQEEALALADRVALLHAGRLVALLPPDQLWTHPPTAFAARFLGFENVVEADIDGRSARTPWGRFEMADGRPMGRTSIVIRPTGVRLVKATASAALPARVARRSFRGDHVVLWLTVDRADGADGADGADPDAPPLVAHVPPPAPAEGELVSFAVDPVSVFAVEP